jgi:hypothetical protein
MNEPVVSAADFSDPEKLAQLEYDGDIIAFVHPLPEFGYVALAPITIGGPDGNRRLKIGDLLHPSEAHDASGVGKLVFGGQVAKLPTDRGVLGLIGALLERCDRLEALLASLVTP